MPGVVLRVSSSRVLVPASASAQARVSVAMPESRWIKFSAHLSPVSSARIRPLTASTNAPASSASPSLASGSSRQSGSSARNTRAAAARPESTSGSLA